MDTILNAVLLGNNVHKYWTMCHLRWPHHVCSICIDLFREARWEILFKQVGIVALSGVGVAPNSTRQRHVRTCGCDTYLTSPIRVTLPEGSRSNSLKLMAGVKRSAGARENGRGHAPSVAAGSPRCALSAKMSGGTVKGASVSPGESDRRTYNPEPRQRAVRAS